MFFSEREDIRIADIIPNRSYLRSNADIPKLYAMLAHYYLTIGLRRDECS